MDNGNRDERLLAMPPLEVDTERALSRFANAAHQARLRPAIGAMASSVPRSRMTPSWIGAPAKWLAAAAAVVIVTTTLTMTGIADSIFQIFEVKQFAAVTVTSTDLQTLGQLSAFGTLTWSNKADGRKVASAAAASSETGLPAIGVTVPASVTAAAEYGVVPRTTATFVFDGAKARASAAAIGRTAPPMPARIDGSTLVFTGGPAILVTYGAADHAATGGTLFVGVAAAPIASSDGASVVEIQAYLLSQPGVSPALAAQIRAIGDPASTLPVPIPSGAAAAKNVSVHGTSGLFVGDSTGLGNGVIWQQNGLVYVVGGTLSEAQTIAVANTLR